MTNKLFFFLFLFILASRVFAGAYEDMEEAFIRNDTAAAIELINRGMDINTVDKQGNTLLTQSIQRDMPDLFNFLIQKKQLFQPLFLQNLDFILLRLFHNHG